MILNKTVEREQQNIADGLINKLDNQFPEIEVYIFALYPGDKKDPLNFNKEHARHTKIKKVMARAKLKEGYYGLDRFRLNFNEINAKGNEIKKRIVYAVKKSCPFEIYYTEDEAYQAYSQRLSEFRIYLNQIHEEQAETFDDFITSNIV